MPSPRYGQPTRRTAARPATRKRQPDWSPAFNIRAATQNLVVDGCRLDLAGMDARQCEAALYWNHRDGLTSRDREAIGRVEQLFESRWGRNLYDLSLHARVRLDLRTEQGRRQWEHHQAGKQLAASITYTADEWPEQIGGWVRSWRLHHITLGEPGEQADERAVTPGWML
ncbi:hypothetical protein [Verrucosispora sp. WMMD1129]|uniref:hypothetical protein n=1 Tax=Verrucosispora sp. WMMD1129 TaxID=3016093 RepID=UPI00249AF894|nr:hypothetical protein [Verrucosispora sp. WMMD1129]WFE46284.1 hypothetical protein O7624_19000 [Verrucosispora sp. WMMD1129]